jgi:hypothetical protein
MPGGNSQSKKKGNKSGVGTEKVHDVLAAKQTTTFKHTTKILEDVKKRLEEFKSGKEVVKDTPKLFKPGDYVTYTSRCIAQNTAAGIVVQYKDDMVQLILHEGIDCLYKKMQGAHCSCREVKMKFYEKELTIFGEMKTKSSSPDYAPPYTGSPPPQGLEHELAKGGAVTPSWPPKTAEEIAADNEAWAKDQANGHPYAFTPASTPPLP